MNCLAAHGDKGDQWGYVPGYELRNKQKFGRSKRRAESNKACAEKDQKITVWSMVGALVGITSVIFLLSRWN